MGMLLLSTPCRPLTTCVPQRSTLQDMNSESWRVRPWGWLLVHTALYLQYTSRQRTRDGTRTDVCRCRAGWAAGMPAHRQFRERVFKKFKVWGELVSRAFNSRCLLYYRLIGKWLLQSTPNPFFFEGHHNPNLMVV